MMKKLKLIKLIYNHLNCNIFFIIAQSQEIYATDITFLKL